MTTDDLAREQRDYWNGKSGERWASEQARTDRNLAQIGLVIIDRAEPRPTDRVLDVGCGCGTTTFQLRAQAQAAHGIDISAPMIAVAREKAVGSDVTFELADAATHAFTPTYDLVFSRFGVMFFADPVAAFANLRRALAPGGRLAFVCWRALADNPWAAAPLAACKDLLPPMTPPDPTAPGPFAFADRDRVVGLLERAGWRPTIERVDTTMDLGTVEDAVVSALSIGPLARAAAELPEATRAQIVARMPAVYARYKSERGVVFPAAVWIVTAAAI